MREKTDMINSPGHYRDGGIEVIDYIEAKGFGYHLGNVVKYVSRAGKKGVGKGLEDLQKARWYLDREIKRMEDEAGKTVMENDSVTSVEKMTISEVMKRYPLTEKECFKEEVPVTVQGVLDKLGLKVERYPRIEQLIYMFHNELTDKEIKCLRDYEAAITKKVEEVQRDSIRNVMEDDKVLDVGWVKCSDRMPVPNLLDKYWVYHPESNSVFSLLCSTESNAFYNHHGNYDGITHWMLWTRREKPLPPKQ